MDEWGDGGWWVSHGWHMLTPPPFSISTTCDAAKTLIFQTDLLGSDMTVSPRSALCCRVVGGGGVAWLPLFVTWLDPPFFQHPPLVTRPKPWISKNVHPGQTNTLGPRRVPVCRMVGRKMLDGGWPFLAYPPLVTRPKP